MKNFKYIYGPVYSWRLGMSLGIDPISTEQKLCNFDCVYCQLGESFVKTVERKVFVPAQEIVDEINQLDPDLEIDYLTFSGRGEPTLAQNLGEMISLLRSSRKEKIAVITNAGLMGDEKVREDLMKADCVLAKLDACDQMLFEKVDRPESSERLDNVIEGLRIFAKEFKGKLALQMMFIEFNKDSVEKMAKVAALIGADEIELNTPLRPCGIKPLSEDEMQMVKKHFEHLSNVTMLYERERKKVEAIDLEQAKRRHGEYT